MDTIRLMGLSPFRSSSIWVLGSLLLSAPACGRSDDESRSKGSGGESGDTENLGGSDSTLSSGGTGEGTTGGAPSGGTGSGTGSSTQTSGGAESGDGGGGGDGSGGGAGGAPPTACTTCEEGYECFEQVDSDRCFKTCQTESPDVQITTQEEVAALAALDCEVIAGNLEFASNQLTDLSGLEMLRVVRGTLRVFGTQNLPDLDGLELLYVDKGLEMSGNSGLAGIAALANTQFGPGVLSLNGNTALTSLDGLQGLVEPAGITVTSSPVLADISALSPQHVSDNVLIAGNEAIETIHFPDLQTVDGSFAVYASTLCQSLELPALNSLTGDLTVSGNPALTEIEVPSLTRVGGIAIADNALLESLGGLPALTEVNAQLTITMNPSLPQCEVAEIAARFAVACTYCTGNDESGICN